MERERLRRCCRRIEEDKKKNVQKNVCSNSVDRHSDQWRIQKRIWGRSSEVEIRLKYKSLKSVIKNVQICICYDPLRF